MIGYYIELRHEGQTLKSEYLKTSLRDKTFKDLEAKTLYEVRMNSENANGTGEWRMVSINTTEACKSRQVNWLSFSSAAMSISALRFLLISTEGVGRGGGGKVIPIMAYIWGSARIRKGYLLQASGIRKHGAFTSWSIRKGKSVISIFKMT